MPSAAQQHTAKPPNINQHRDGTQASKLRTGMTAQGTHGHDSAGPCHTQRRAGAQGLWKAANGEALDRRAPHAG